MKRVNKILCNQLFVDSLHHIEKAESDRIYCKHDICHLLNVCRIAYIKVLERGINISKEIIYATGLLHDIGRSEQYLKGVPHYIAGQNIIIKILQESMFEQWEIDIIKYAIIKHNARDEENVFNAIIYEADKESRLCMFCCAKETCKWETKNLTMGD